MRPGILPEGFPWRLALALSVLLLVGGAWWLFKNKPWISTTYPTLRDAVLAGDESDIQRHLSKGEDIDSRIGLGTSSRHPRPTLLAFFAYLGDYRGVKLLIENGANVNARDRHRITVLDSTVRSMHRIRMSEDPQNALKEHTAIIDLLLTHGATAEHMYDQGSKMIQFLADTGEVELFWRVVDKAEVPAESLGMLWAHLTVSADPHDLAPAIAARLSDADLAEAKAHAERLSPNSSSE